MSNASISKVEDVINNRTKEVMNYTERIGSPAEEGFLSSMDQSQETDARITIVFKKIGDAYVSVMCCSDGFRHNKELVGSIIEMQEGIGEKVTVCTSEMYMRDDTIADEDVKDAARKIIPKALCIDILENIYGDAEISKNIYDTKMKAIEVLKIVINNMLIRKQELVDMNFREEVLEHKEIQQLCRVIDVRNIAKYGTKKEAMLVDLVNMEKKVRAMLPFIPEDVMKSSLEKARKDIENVKDDLSDLPTGGDAARTLVNILRKMDEDSENN